MITIIILIILAAISIQAITGTGLFDKAKQARNDYQNSEKVEQNRLNEYVNAINNEINGGSTSGNTKKQTGTTITKDGTTETITASNAKNYYGEAVDYKPATDTAGTYRIFYYDANGDFGDKGTIYLKRDWEANNVNLNTATSSYTVTEDALNMMKKMNKDWAKR